MPTHRENHLVSRIGWLRAGVLGANDGIVSIASLIIGVAASGAASRDVLIAGAAGLVAGAMSMATGEYVSVSSQSDTECADLARERSELAAQPDLALDELTAIYRERGLSEATARAAAEEMTAFDALAAHARDELHITDMTKARPVVAALTSATTFTAGALLPLLLVLVVPSTRLVMAEGAASLLFLALLGGIGARAGGAPIGKAIVRVVAWGGLAMLATAGIGRLFGAAV